MREGANGSPAVHPMYSRLIGLYRKNHSPVPPPMCRVPVRFFVPRYAKGVQDNVMFLSVSKANDGNRLQQIDPPLSKT